MSPDVDARCLLRPRPHRTLLRGASGPILTGALRSAGVISDRAVPGENLLYRLFNAIGGNRPAMLLARQGARFSAAGAPPSSPR